MPEVKRESLGVDLVCCVTLAPEIAATWMELHMSCLEARGGAGDGPPPRSARLNDDENNKNSLLVRSAQPLFVSTSEIFPRNLNRR